MQTLVLTPEILGLAGTLILVLFLALLGCIIFLRRLSTLQKAMLQLQEASQEAKNTTHQFHASTEAQIQRLQAAQDLQTHQLQSAQSSTQSTVTTTQQETLRSVRDLQALQQTSQALMLEIKTQQKTAQSFFTEWQKASQALISDWQKDTTELRRALQTTYQQGTWGEQELRRVVELSGMVPHCDFDVQVQLPNAQKPDMIIYMHDNRSIVVDAKAPSQVYLDAVYCEEEKARAVLLKGYARRVRDIIMDLGKREYWKQMPSSPAFVILFMPNEAMLRAAFDADPTLFDLAVERNVLLASPMLLIALLKAIAHGWSQEDRARNVQRIIDESKKLHKVLESWFNEWQLLKKAIAKTGAEFDRVARDYQERVLPIITGLGELDSTLLVKEKAFDLVPLNGNMIEERTGADLVLEETSKNGSTPNTSTEPLDRRDAPVTE